MMGGDSRRGEKLKEKKKTRQKTEKSHEYGMCVPCDLNIHDMTISMS